MRVEGQNGYISSTISDIYNSYTLLQGQEVPIQTLLLLVALRSWGPRLLHLALRGYPPHVRTVVKLHNPARSPERLVVVFELGVSITRSVESNSTVTTAKPNYASFPLHSDELLGAVSACWEGAPPDCALADVYCAVRQQTFLTPW